MATEDEPTVVSPRRRLAPQVQRWEGEVLDDRFEIVRFLARGSTGAVFVAKDLQLGNDVAVKVLHRDATAETERRFRAEIRVLARLRDPRILRPLAWGTTPSEHVYLVTELLHGAPLDQKLDRVGRVRPRRLLGLMMDVCRALIEAHAAGVVHRDLKPGNLFIERSRGGEETCRVLDFGIAKVVGDSSLLTVGQRVQTETGFLVGTLNYMAPEQIEGGEVDGRTDLYALGAILFTCLTGRRPYGGDANEVLRKHLTAPVPSLNDVDSEVRFHPELDALVRKLMAKSPKERPSSALQVLRTMERLVRQPDLEGSESSGSARKGRVWIWAGVVLLVVAGVMAWMLG